MPELLLCDSFAESKTRTHAAPSFVMRRATAAACAAIDVEFLTPLLLLKSHFRVSGKDNPALLPKAFEISTSHVAIKKITSCNKETEEVHR